ncbi:Nucleotidyl transferase AbiEii toxin, Type IV TA system [Tepidimonas thermarum]|uniref:Nucleotidyl transferase AbiEii toxin, Type IV TA system n=1 Tax=Tepidimonas thermarum TaxID=335431 RepID=A0A554WW45_9BURK|nr:nucleotidyl transferase AbiEii/AbiGii toxin family protein [Tepidimonas thermarum]TSE27797.1 Nucleotidyl transferase AbiEii toxin, Type IV TA system [Tepidimonas thermarum]
MRTITERERDLILDVRNEGLTSLPPAIIEKDLLITEVLRTVVAADSDDIQLVFCGGTCLSKAHGLIARMSEDIDFKLVLPPDLSRNARARLLSQFKKRMAAILENAGFAVPTEEIVARDENSYVLLNLHYESRFAPVASLRPEIKVELNARAPLLPTARLPIVSMLDALIQTPRTDCQVQCIGVEEAVLEKVLSFLRRTAKARASHRRAAADDDRLVRHLYDVAAIARRRQGLALPHECFVTLVADDAAQFRHQYPEFEDDPVSQMRAALQALHHDADAFERDYRRFVDELVFGEPLPFAQARAVFIELAESLIEQMKA